MRIAIADTETTGFDPKENKIVEYAHVVLDTETGLVERYQSLVNPHMAIPVEAMAIHHITDEMVAEAPDLEDVLNEAGIADIDVFVAHNAKFDRSFLPMIAKPWVCTYKPSVVTWPEAPSHKNQVLRYYLKLVCTIPPEAGLMAHRALYDACVTAALFEELQKHHSIEELIHITENPILLPSVRFGKHAGKQWAEVRHDRGYLSWILREDFDEDTKYTAKYWLNGGNA